MKSHVTRILLAIGATTMLGACASLSNVHEAPVGEGAVAQVHHGLTQDQVGRLAGSPKGVSNEPRLEETVWIYYYMDSWNYPSELDVSFDTSGEVSDISTERLHY
jgi:outer membrane protein assembly factor BamE (lipoprotein component of BamABCDE complex)